MKVLTKLQDDSDNCRVYVKDQDGNKYVILDHGISYAKNGLPRYELHTHTRDGEPDIPLTGHTEAVNAYIKKNMTSGEQINQLENEVNAYKVVLAGVMKGFSSLQAHAQKLIDEVDKMEFHTHKVKK